MGCNARETLRALSAFQATRSTQELSVTSVLKLLSPQRALRQEWPPNRHSPRARAWFGAEQIERPSVKVNGYRSYPDRVLAMSAREDVPCKAVPGLEHVHRRQQDSSEMTEKWREETACKNRIIFLVCQSQNVIENKGLKVSGGVTKPECV